MLRRLFVLLLLILVFSLVLPGVALAQDNSTQETKSGTNTLIIEAPGQIEVGQTLTLIAQVRENEYNEHI